MRNLKCILVGLLLTPCLLAEPVQKVVVQTLEGQNFYEFQIPAGFTGGAIPRPGGTAYETTTFYVWLNKATKERLAVNIHPTEATFTPDSKKRIWAKLSNDNQGAAEVSSENIYGAKFWVAGYGGYQSRWADLRSNNRSVTFQLSHQGEKGKTRSRSLEQELDQILSSLKAL